MAFLTSSELFDTVFGMAPKNKETKQFLTKLADYLQGKQASPLAKTMGKHIAAGGTMASFTCREDLFMDIADELYEYEIPYAPTATNDGKTGFIVRKQDEEQAMQVCKEMLQVKGKFCRVLTGEDIIKKVAISKEQDKSCIAVYGLTPGQAQLMKDRFAKYFEHAEIGLDQMEDGTMMITLLAKDAVKRNIRSAPDLCTVYLETILASTGPNRIKNEAYAELKIAMQDRLAKGFYDGKTNLNKTPLWIVGYGSQYITITANGFTYGRAVRRGDEIQFIPYEQADTTQPDYKQLLISYSSRIPFPIVTYNSTEVIHHFQRQTGEDMDVLDVSPSSQYRAYARGEKLLSKQLDQMVTRKIQNDQIMNMDGRQNEKFLHYIEALKELLKAFILGRIPKGYEPSDGKILQDILKKYQMDGEMYEQSLLAIRDIEAVTISASIERIADVEKKIEKERGMEVARKREEKKNRGRTKSTLEKE